ncbi:autotransporter domain-containing protein [Microvirga guangxiensis]|uniref:Uncharacterized conserved protein, contains a C-terminal beta-barrel porin domain n=1 Tax=Microvirga guangxiensis TaxID=549386 RepID=A0A1G5JR65_9HYPH|nr:autotransporter domain-containing protein [Microvirga guangxiensis]SCY90893.1 Uncharacterized conserved protein, contains a C-terminal beta-barrel porin domain [Microvirga guangxiensis]
MPFEVSIRNHQRRQLRVCGHAFSVVSAPILILVSLAPAHAQKVDAGPGETKTVPPFVMLASDTALYAHEGGRIQGSGSTVTTTGSYAHGGTAETGGVIALDRGSITTDGRSAMGLYAFGTNSHIVSSSDLTTFGTGAYAAFARAGGVITLTHGSIQTAGADAFGLLTDGTGSQITSEALVSTTGANAPGVAATAGGTLTLTRGAIRTSGVAAFGLYSSGGQSHIDSAVEVSTTGDYSHGALIQAGGSATLTAGTVTTTGRDAAGLLVEGAGSRLVSSANVTTSGPGAIGILSRFAGFVEQIGGWITSTGPIAHGLFATGHASSITSTATVQTAGAGAAGAFADAGGTIVVGGTIATTGSSAPGLLANGTGSTITSTAQITTTGQDGYGVQAVNGGSVWLTGGAIHTSGNGAQGIRSIGTGSSVTGSARISVSGSQAAGVAALSGGTVHLLGGSVTTTGSGHGLYAFGSGSTISGGAEISTRADGTAAALADGRGAIALSGGTIRTTGSQSSGIAATYGGSAAIDHVTISTLGPHSAGASVTAAALAVTNSRIDSGGAGIASLGNATVQVSHATVRSRGPVFDAVFDLAGQAATFNVLNTQLRGDAGLLKVTRGDNGRDGIVTLTLDGSEAIGTVSDLEGRTSGYTRVVMTGGSRLAGGMNGVDRLTLDQGTWRIDGPTNVAVLETGPSGGTLESADQAIVLAAPLEGAGELIKAGPGLLTLTGDSALSGATSVVAGTLAVNGSLRNSPVNVGSGAVLTGDGTIGGLSAQSGSTISPGTTVGTMTVTGDVNFLPGSVYAVGLGPAGQADRIAASGRATLAGGLVEVLPDQGAVYRANSPYTILNASSVSGAFEGATGAEFAFVSPTLGYGENAVVLTLTRRTDPGRSTFASVALTRNQGSTAAAIERLGAGHELFDTVLGSSIAGARQAFDALSGEIHSSAMTTALQDAQLVQNAVLARLRQPQPRSRPYFTQSSYHVADPAGGSTRLSALPARTFDPRRFVLWGEGAGSWGTVKSNGNADDLDTATGGFLLGAEANVDDVYRIGMAGGFVRTTFDADARLSSGSTETVFGSLYGGASWGRLNARLGSSYAFHDYDIQRSVRFPGFNGTAAASYGGWTAQAFAELGYRFEVAPVAIEPFVNASLLRTHTNGFAEAGGAAALIGRARDYDLGTTTVGVRAEAQAGDRIPLLVRGMIGWRHAHSEVEPEMVLAFRGSSSTFTISGVPLNRYTLVTEAGIYWQAGRSFNMGVSYEGQIGASAQEHSVKGSFISRF